MSIAIVNATISGTLVVGGTSTLTGALTSGSTLNAQGITSTTLNLTNNLVQSGTGNLASGTGGISCNANLVVSGNTIINSNCNILGNINLTRDLVAGATTITNTQLGFISGLTSNAQTQISAIIPTLIGQTNAWTGLNTYNTTIPTTTISATTANQLCNKTYTDATATTAGTTATTNLKGATNTWTGVNTYNNNVILPTATYLSDAGLFLRNVGDTNHKLQYNVTSDGPALQGLGGGRLGIAGNPTILTWSGTTIDMNVRTSFNNEIRMNVNPLYLKSVGDNNHLLQYTGAPYDGVALQGGSGGKIGTVAKTDMINWTSSAGINTVNVSANTNLTGNVNILPYTSNTTLSAYTVNCNAITSLGQIVAGGVGIVTAKLQCSNNGTGILGLQCGTYTAVTDANQTVTFPNAFLGSNPPLVFLQPKYANAVTGTAYVISTSLTNFTYRFFFDGSVNSESAVVMYWSAYQI